PNPAGREGDVEQVAGSLAVHLEGASVPSAERGAASQVVDELDVLAAAFEASRVQEIAAVDADAPSVQIPRVAAGPDQTHDAEPGTTKSFHEVRAHEARGPRHQHLAHGRIPRSATYPLPSGHALLLEPGHVVLDCVGNGEGELVARVVGRRCHSL